MLLPFENDTFLNMIHVQYLRQNGSWKNNCLNTWKNFEKKKLIYEFIYWNGNHRTNNL